MSILNILIWVIGALIVGLYTFFEVRKTLKFKKAYNKYIEQKYTPIQAKEKAMKEIYPKKYAKIQKKTNQENDTIFEE